MTTPTARLVALWDHLGLSRAHVAGQIPADLAGLATQHPDRLGGIVLCGPVRLDPAAFAATADRLLMIGGDRGLGAAIANRAVARLPGAQSVVLADYEVTGWADIVADHTAAVGTAMTEFLARHPADAPTAPARSGSHAGITYRIDGAGPALVLLPFFLAPTQWAPAAAALARQFTVITLGGRHLGGVAMLEDRAAAPSYQAMFRTLVDLLAPAPGEPILDVGCGAGSLDRALARRLGATNPITAADTNPFLLGEAAALAAAEGLAGSIRFVRADAETLPDADATYGCVFSVTVIEECDADRAIAEMVRVARPGGRVGVVVRAIDLPQWWSLDLPAPLQRKVSLPPQSVGPRGAADAGLYHRMRAAGLVDLTCYPFLVTLDRPDGPIWRYREDHVLASLDADETRVWHAARAAAVADGTLLTAHAVHCAVGTKPAA